MELIVLTAALSLANIFGVQAVTHQMPEHANQQYPQAYEERVAQSEEGDPQSLLEAVVKFKKEKGWI